MPSFPEMLNLGNKVKKGNEEGLKFSYVYFLLLILLKRTTASRGMKAGVLEIVSYSCDSCALFQFDFLRRSSSLSTATPNWLRNLCPIKALYPLSFILMSLSCGKKNSHQWKEAVILEEKACQKGKS